MASVNFPLTFSLAPIPTGEALDANAYGQQLVANLQAFISGNFLTGQIGGSAPTQNVGPWLNGNTWWFWDPGTSTYVQQSLTSSLPSGSILAFGGITAPTGFLLCDGSSYLISDQTALFNAIGTLYGTAGGGTFRVPDYRGRVLLGAGSGPGLTPRTVATSVGEENHLLIPTELASHNHTQNAHQHVDFGHLHADSGHFHSDSGHRHLDAGHQHSYTSPVSTTAGAGSSSFSSNGSTLASTATSFADILTGHADITEGFSVITTGFAQIEFSTATNNATPAGASHNNMQPSLVAAYIIRT